MVEIAKIVVFYAYHVSNIHRCYFNGFYDFLYSMRAGLGTRLEWTSLRNESGRRWAGRRNPRRKRTILPSGVFEADRDRTHCQIKPPGLEAFVEKRQYSESAHACAHGMQVFAEATSVLNEYFHQFQAFFRCIHA